MRFRGLLLYNLPALSIYLLCAAILTFLIFADSGFISNDDYYHTRLATEIITQRSLRVDFTWLPLTILNSADYVDHHLLFHIYLAPWAYIGGMTGAKLAAVSIAAGIFLAIWLLLRQSGVRHATWWTLALFAVSIPFLSRMLMVRTQGAAVLLLIIMLNLMFKERYRWLILIAFAFTWLYNGYILIVAVAGLYCAAVWLIDQRIVWKPVIYCLIGVAAGLVINPYFPLNIQFTLQHLGAKVDFSSGIRVGDEWYPYTTAELMSHSPGALLMLGAGLLFPGLTGRKFDRKSLTLGLVAGLTLVMTLQSKRFIEYFPPFALLFASFVVDRGALPAFAMGFTFQSGWSYRMAKAGASLVAGMILIFFVAQTLPVVYKRVQETKDAATFAGASAWLRDHAPANTVVFQTDWDDFTRLFYYNVNNTYVSGLDPTYFQLENHDLWTTWEQIRSGKVENPSQLIQSEFGATYVVSDQLHRDFRQQVEHDPAMQLVFDDQYSSVWQINTPTLTEGSTEPVSLNDLMNPDQEK